MALPPTPGAALYVRASTEHQNYSTDHQESAQREYAAQHDFEVVAVYRDEVDLRSMDETDFCDSSRKSSRGRQTLSPSWCTTLAAGDDSKMSTRVPITSTHAVKPALRSPTVLSLSQMMAPPRDFDQRFKACFQKFFVFARRI